MTKTTKTKPETTETFTLLVWEEVPETTKLYLIPNSTLDAEDHTTLKTANGNYINGGTDNDDGAETALDCINNALCEDAKYLDDDHPAGSKWAQRWKDYEQGKDKPIEGVIVTHVYVCGFLL